MNDVLECSVVELPNRVSHATKTTSESEIPLDDTSSCPYFSSKKSLELLHRLTKTASDLSPQLESEEDDDYDCSTPMSKVFSLCAALWGKLPFYSPDIGKVYLFFFSLSLISLFHSITQYVKHCILAY